MWVESPGVTYGDEFVLIGEQEGARITAEEVAERATNDQLRSHDRAARTGSRGSTSGPTEGRRGRDKGARMAEPIEIDVWQGEIAELEVDALVVAANESLFMTAGAAASVKRHGGDDDRARRGRPGTDPARLGGGDAGGHAGGAPTSSTRSRVGHDRIADRERAGRLPSAPPSRSPSRSSCVASRSRCTRHRARRLHGRGRRRVIVETDAAPRRARRQSRRSSWPRRTRPRRAPWATRWRAGAGARSDVSDGPARRAR